MQGAITVLKVLQASDRKVQAPAAGYFGMSTGARPDVSVDRPAGCPSSEQFEARFGRSVDAKDQRSEGASGEQLRETPDRLGLPLRRSPDA